MAMYSPSTYAIVCYEDKLVEIDDPSITMGDICDALGIPVERGVRLIRKSSGQVVATLPYDTIARRGAKAEAAPAESGLHPDGVDDVLDDEPEDSDGVEQYELVRSEAPSAAAQTDEAKKAGGAVLQEVVHLGAVELLSTSSAQQLATAKVYQPDHSPYFLECMAYAQTVYSPFRDQRDPLRGPRGPPNAPADEAGDWGMDQYKGAVEPYDIPVLYRSEHH